MKKSLNGIGLHAWSVKIGEKGQFVIPKEARELFDIAPGDTVLLLADEKKGLAIPPKSLMSSMAARIFATDGEDEEK